MSTDNASYVSASLREQDRDRYLSSLVLSDKKRAAVQTLMAFNADVAGIASRVSEPAPGEIRLQWWADALEGREHGAVRQNPIASGLLDLLNEYDLSSGPLVRLVAARRFDLYQDPMPDMATFEGYAGETCSILYQYAAGVLADGDIPEDGNAAGHIGVAHALVGHIRAFPHNAARGRIFLPWDRFVAGGVSEGDVFSGRDSDSLRTVLRSFCEDALSHLDKAEDAVRALPRTIRPAFAHLAILKLQLTAAKRASGFSEPLREPADWRKILALYFWTARNA